MSKKKDLTYEKLTEYQQKQHEENQKKIKAGMKVNLLLPLLFLVIAYLTKGSKLIFLLLWVISLFLIAAYLVYVEYSDFKLQEQLKEVGIAKDEEIQSLVGAEVVEAGEKLEETIDALPIPEKVKNHPFRNIGKIIATDIKRLSTNVIAFVVIIGLSVIPSLYAWFNIFSNWDPYGPAATKNLQVAVASSDQGVSVGGMALNVGDKIIDSLKENDSIGWVFPENEAKAIAMVEAGDVYAALVVEEEFSKNLISFIGGDPVNPKIVYYENEKKNAIAPKITGKVKTTIKNQVDRTFVSTIAAYILDAGNALAGAENDGSLSSGMVSQLQALLADLNTYIGLIESYDAMIKSTNAIMDAAQTLSDQMDVMLLAASEMSISADAAADAVQGAVSAMSSSMSSSMSSLNTLINSMKTVTEVSTETIQLAYDSISKGANTAAGLIPTESNVINRDSLPNDEAKNAYDDINKQYDALKKDLEKMSQDAKSASGYSQYMFSGITSDLNSCIEDAKSLSNEYQSVIEPQINSMMSSIQKSVNKLQSALNYSSSGLKGLSTALHSYPNMMNSTQATLDESLVEAKALRDELEGLIKDIDEIDDDSMYGKFLTLLEKDPEYIADFISTPVELTTEAIYPIDYNGSATAPFYLTLSLWVGGLMISTIFKPKVKEIEGVENVKNSQCFWGRYFSTFVVAQIQCFIAYVGAMVFVGIQAEHPMLLLLCGLWTAFVFSFFMYALAYTFGNVGQALAVILMVIQVAGAGGTFPIEVLPKVFQYLYRFMPFMYSMNAARECVAGMYENNYWSYMAGLIPFVLAAIFIGIALYSPAQKLNALVDKSKERSGILI